MTYQEKESGKRSWNAIDCAVAGKSLRYYKRKSHKKLRQILKREMERDLTSG